MQPGREKVQSWPLVPGEGGEEPVWAGEARTKSERGEGPLGRTDRWREGRGWGKAWNRTERGTGMPPSHVGVQVPQALRGVGGGLHAGDRLVEGVASGLLGLDATSSPAFPVQTLGNVLEVPAAQEGLWRQAGLCPSPMGVLAPAEHRLTQVPPASWPLPTLASAAHSPSPCPLGERLLGQPALLCSRAGRPSLLLRQH